MNSRRRKGATLGLVAVCVLVIIIIGIGGFFLCKLFGGGREVANATDAGALNVAKQALVYVDTNPTSPLRVPFGSSDFAACSMPPGQTITLLTYNRCVAQALLVALNAQQEGGPALAHAAIVLGDLNKIASQLKKDLTNPSLMTPFFNTVAQANNTRMFGNDPKATAVNAVSASFKTAFMKTGFSTNIWVSPAELPATTPGPIKTALTQGQAPGYLAPSPPGGGNYPNYLPGYVGYNVPGVGTIYGVPVFPQQKAHLVALADFQPDIAAAPDGANGVTPPNAFMFDSSAKDMTTNSFSGAVACAIVGAVKQVGANPPPYDFGASLPGGYIEIYNQQGHTLPAGYQGFNNSNNIFNNELLGGPGVFVDQTPNGAAFTSSMGALSAWGNYNATQVGVGKPGNDSLGPYTGDSNGQDPRLNPLNPSSPNYFPNSQTQIFVSNNPGTVDNTPTPLTALLAIPKQQPKNCLQQLDATGWLDPATACGRWLPSFEAVPAWGGQPGGMNPGNSSPTFSAVDMAKGQLIYDFNSGSRNATYDVNGPSIAPSGMGVYNNPNAIVGNDTMPSPQWNTPIEQPGTVMQLLNQLNTEPGGSCALTNVLTGIVQRCQEIQPTTTQQQVIALLNTKLQMGNYLYIYRANFTDPNSPLQITNNPPPTQAPAGEVGLPIPTYNAGSMTYSNNGGGHILPDGSIASSGSSCNGQYGLIGNIVDVHVGGTPQPGNPGFFSSFGNDPLKGDDVLHDRPYQSIAGNLEGNDTATWQVSSGYHNLLGVLTFANQVSGDAHFSRPN